MSPQALSDEMVDAVARDDVDRVAALLDAGADANARNERGETAFSVACASNSLAVAKLLYARGADINVVDADGGSPLDWAVCWSSPEFRQWLIDVGGRRNDVSYQPWPWLPVRGEKVARTRPGSETVPCSRSDAATDYWIRVMCGTAWGGGLFGLLLGGPGGAICWAPLALLVAVPICCSVALLSWALWLSRYLMLTAIASGAATGLVCTAGVISGLGDKPPVEQLVLAAVLGGLGAGVATRQFVCNSETGRWLSAVSKSSPRTFSLRELFVHFTVVALVIAFWAAIVNASRARYESAKPPLPEIERPIGAD